MIVPTPMALAAVVTALAAPVLAKYSVVEDYAPSAFFDHFNFYTGADPTHGFVQYIDRPTAQQTGLVSSNGSVAYMGVDHQTVSSGGRASVRLESRNTYTHGLFIADIAHMPGDVCGVWPAFWTFGPNWPNNGEIDIIEAVNRDTNNHLSLHTADRCHMTGATALTNSTGDNCFAFANGNAGCGAYDPNPQSFGAGFNRIGGGVYAVEWTSQHIAIWFFPRDRIPKNVLSPQPDPAQWGTPVADWSGGGCDIDSHFREHQIIFDTTFCGDWAGSVWSNSGCASTAASSCTDFVANHPAAFADAFWLINSLKVFEAK
ncbi:MAG: hypothetical protein M1826_005335 [Phylliscum demangeonii]|nr:MAG: hypothetical protein M1826_005335 [Phylliscum demangeonii]